MQCKQTRSNFTVTGYNYCHRKPCKNGGRCRNYETEKYCTCRDGFIGKYCQCEYNISMYACSFQDLFTLTVRKKHSVNIV